MADRKTEAISARVRRASENPISAQAWIMPLSTRRSTSQPASRARRVYSTASGQRMSRVPTNILSIGRVPRRRYAARRPLRGSAEPLEIFEIDRDGRSAQLGLLHLAHPDGSVVEFGTS